MEISATSFRNLLREISGAVLKKKPALYYKYLLRETLEQRAPYDEEPADSEMLLREKLSSGKVLGREHEKEQLLSKLINDPYHQRIQFSVIPILGSRGIGKTTLARLVYDDKRVKEHFEVRVWVTVDGQELNLQHAARGILKSTMGMSCSLDDVDELDEMVRDVLQSQRCLIVFDGIESMAKDSWLHMNKKWFDFVDLGSSIVITTTSKDVAHLVSNLPFELTQLSADDSWSLCVYLAFESTQGGIKNISSPMAENLSALCRGNPLALKLVGSMMRHDEKLRNLLYSMDFSDLIPSDVTVPVLLCIWALPPLLRQCLAYCAIFPKGYALNKKKVIDMWIACGIVKPSDPGNNSLEDIGNACFLQLLCRSFFMDITCNEYGDITEFRMSGLIHETLLDLARIFWNGKLGMIGSIGADAGQLSLVFPFTKTYHPIHLETLILSPTIYLGDCSLDHSLLEFKDLQSLDLSCSGIRNLSDDICALKELRYLNLSYTFIERLPDSITDLSWLQSLILTGCYHLQVLPKKMRHLTHMKHLDLWLCDSLSYLPSGIGFLTSLNSMQLFVLGKDHDCAGLGELGLLNQLQGKLEIRNLENVTEIIEAQNAKLDQKNLHHLGLSWSQNADNCFSVLELLQPNSHRRVIDLTGYMGFDFPRWMSSINSLIKISITDCGCKELPSLGQLPSLKELQLKGMTNLEHIGPEFYGDGTADVLFPSLEQLGLYDLPVLLEWSGETRPNSCGVSYQCVFPSLETLTIEGCPKLISLPSLPTLSDLTVWRSNKSILSSLTSFTSLSSLLINDMELGVSNFQYLTWLDSLKKLILCNIKDKLIVNISHVGATFTALEHLGILHCHQLTDLCLFYFSSLQKLHIVDCPNLFRILVREEEDTPLVELVVEDCPEVSSEICFGKLRSLRKLVAKNCGDHFTIYYAGDYKKLEKLEYLSISHCPRIQRDLQTFPSLISHVQCIIVGDHKANYYKDMQDLMKVPIKASYESNEEDSIHQIGDPK